MVAGGLISLAFLLLCFPLHFASSHILVCLLPYVSFINCIAVPFCCVMIKTGSLGGANHVIIFPLLGEKHCPRRTVKQGELKFFGCIEGGSYGQAVYKMHLSFFPVSCKTDQLCCFC